LAAHVKGRRRQPAARAIGLKRVPERRRFPGAIRIKIVNRDSQAR
jgi:hypothetical protein